MPRAIVPATELVPDTQAGCCEQRNVIFSMWNKEQDSDGARLPEPGPPPQTMRALCGGDARRPSFPFLDIFQG